MTKFGSKALRLNNQYGHNDSCLFDSGIDRVRKEFVVTDSNRIFNIWYAIVFENPNEHVDQQPFLRINCSLNPENNLCFDANFISCDTTSADTSCEYDKIIFMDWVCHQFKIPASEIGETAYLDIMVADCGRGGHFGYAYIDGICEDCETSELGSVSVDTSVNFLSCDSTLAHLTGTYTLPEVCEDSWNIDTILFPGFTIEKMTINESTKTFSFDFPIGNFSASDSCLKICAKILFVDDSLRSVPPQFSDPFMICKSNYTSPDYLGDITTGNCDNNGTTEDISDDYYFVTVEIQNATGENWSITRELDDPYPNETALHEIESGIGNNSNIELGPFLIQEGGWEMVITVDTCEYVFEITPPNYCSGCTGDLRELIVDNVTCNSSNDTWSFDIYVPGTSGTFYIIGPGYPQGTNLTKGTTHTISSLTIGTTCNEYLLRPTSTSGCDTYLYVCPPKPCDDCDLQVYVEEITCSVENQIVSYTVQLDVDNGTSDYLCYEAIGQLSLSSLASGQLPGSQSIGTFTEDIILTVYLCSNSDCSTGCTPPSCFKVRHISKPESALCDEEESLVGRRGKFEGAISHEVSIWPNPTRNNTLTIESNLLVTEFQLLDLSGRVLKEGIFAGSAHEIQVDGINKVYLIRYKSNNGEFKYLKLLRP